MVMCVGQSCSFESFLIEHITGTDHISVQYVGRDSSCTDSTVRGLNSRGGEIFCASRPSQRPLQ
jgi:hypothetical protein